MLGNIIDYYLELEKQRLIILVGTSGLTSLVGMEFVYVTGDTGSAAIHATKQSKWIDIVVLYPKGTHEYLLDFSSPQGRTSDIQALQMTTHPEPNVTVIGVDGNSDELDRPIKAVFDDKSFTAQHRITSINSINLVRCLAMLRFETVVRAHL